MKTIHVLRHAKSDWGQPGVADHDRPLNQRGIQAAATMAQHLERAEVAPQLILCSTAKRARQTLSGVLPGMPADIEVEIEEDLYLATALDLLSRLRELDDDKDSVMLIGHNPGLQDLVVGLAASGDRLADVSEKFPSAALATLAFAGLWQDLDPETAELTSFVRPKDLP